MKKMIKRSIMVLLAFAAATPAFAQQAKVAPDSVKKVVPATPVKKAKGPKPVKNEISAGVRLNTNGWSLYTDFGKLRAVDAKHPEMFYNMRLLQLEFSEKKNLKQEKLVGDGRSSGGSNGYVYGKINNFYAVKLGAGFRKMLVGKPDPGTVSIHWVNVAGFSLGVLKPYYINVISDPSAIKYSEATASEFLDQQLIEGSAGFFKGLNEVKIIPGGHLKSAVHFDFSSNKKNVIGVEAGANVELYGQKIELMANQPANN
jgi:hypothetical protein